ncbi:hypothetical protein [Aquimarina sp. AU119]|uniref:hypothetical protein n=1 Tax=Aquimarina sp. AU119 TaxID=2108528 RepID=UPI000D69D65F|nr:hypothetical protein [Aquimarina sp. AU119]
MKKNMFTQETENLAKEKGFNYISELTQDDLIHQLKAKYNISIIIDSNILIDDNSFEIWKNGKKLKSEIFKNDIDFDKIFLQALMLIS